MRRIYRRWSERFAEEPQEIAQKITVVCDALCRLPVDTGSVERLAHFAEKVAGHPRAFDFDGSHGGLFIRALANRFDLPLATSVEESVKLFHSAGLIYGGMLSQVAVRGIKPYVGDVYDTVCAFYNGRNEAHILTLENVSCFDRLEIFGKVVFVIENPIVFSAVHEQLTDVTCTLLCAENGRTPAFEKLLELAVQAGAEVYYHGKFDYKGLRLADEIFKKYEKVFVPWRYSKTVYEQLIAANDVLLPDERKDFALHNDELASMLSSMRKNGRAVPITPLADELADDIKKIVQ